MKQQRCIVRYQIATYSGEEIVFCDENDEDEIVIAKCKKQLSRYLPLPYGYQSFKTIERENC